MSRVAVFGNGSLGGVGATVRDGTVADRWELFHALEGLGHEALYLAPTERSPGDQRVVGYAWRGPVDLLVIESRDAAFAPVVVPKDQVHGEGARRRGSDGCPGREAAGGSGYQRFCEECTRLSLYDVGAIPVFPQAEVVRDWTRGAFDRLVDANGLDAGPEPGGVGAGGGIRRNVRPPLLLWDFDMNVRRVWGMSGRTSVYETGAFWRGIAPWMGDALREMKGSGLVRVLAPYDAEASDLLRRRGRASKADKLAGWDPRRDENWEVADRFDWAYPLWLEEWRRGEDDRRLLGEGVPTLNDWSRRAWDLAYTGSDYNRRRRWTELYLGPARRGLSVAVTGVWGDRRKSAEPPPWDRSGFKTWVDEVVGEEELSVDFQGGSNRQLPFEHMLRTLADSRACVQITPDEYSRVGYYTNRIAEATALGVPVFLDREWAGGPQKDPLGRWSDVLGPWSDHPWFSVERGDDVVDRLVNMLDARGRYGRDDAAFGWDGHVAQVRAALIERLHPTLVARRLLKVGGLE